MLAINKVTQSEPSSQLIIADALVGLDQVEDASVALVITSPPYNIGKAYERENKFSIEEYRNKFKPIIKKIIQKMLPKGSVCWQVGNYINKGELTPLDFVFFDMFQSHGLKLRNRIIWQFNFGLHATKRFSGRYETLLWFTKADDYVFNLDPIRVPQIYPGKRHAQSKGGEWAGKPSGNPKGKNPADFWIFFAQDAFINEPVWNIPNIKANHLEKTNHPCQFPHELAERCILAFTNMGDTVLDPFAGSGTSLVAAVKAGRHAIGIEKEAQYVAIAEERLAALNDKRLRLRPSGLRVRSPKPSEAVSKPPSEWTEA